MEEWSSIHFSLRWTVQLEEKAGAGALAARLVAFHSCLSAWPLKSGATLKRFGSGANSTRGITDLAQRGVSDLPGSTDGSNNCSIEIAFKSHQRDA